MAGIDHSIYFQQQPLDIMGNVQKGMSIKDGRDQKALAAKQLEQQNAVNEAYRAGIVQNPDGTTSYDQSKGMTALSQLTGNPYAGNAIRETGLGMQQKAFEQEKYKNLLGQQEIDNQYRKDALASSAADRKSARDQSYALANIASGDRRFQAGIAQQEKDQALQTPYGLANTVDDAKQLKEAHESKKNFDSKLQEMISLREGKGGGAVWDREAVARGQQLSKDLLLEYKNMAKLGVLSQSDEAIINAIIPADPLEYNSPMAAIQGQDPILSNLKKFQADKASDFNTRVQTRTRSGLAGKPTDAPDGKKPSWAL